MYVFVHMCMHVREGEREKVTYLGTIANLLLFSIYLLLWINILDYCQKFRWLNTNFAEIRWNNHPLPIFCLNYAKI